MKLRAYKEIHLFNFFESKHIYNLQIKNYSSFFQSAFNDSSLENSPRSFFMCAVCVAADVTGNHWITFLSDCTRGSILIFTQNKLSILITCQEIKFLKSSNFKKINWTFNFLIWKFTMAFVFNINSPFLPFLYLFICHYKV